MPLPLPDSGFDRVAAFYDPLSRLVYGQALWRAQQYALAAGLPAGTPHLLVVGGGTGQVLLEVLRLRPEASVVYLEASPKMLTAARNRLLQEQPTAVAQVEFRLGTEGSLTRSEAFDGLITFFFLDLFDSKRLRQVVNQLTAVRKPGAPWLVADFALPRTWWQRGLLATMYQFFRLTTGISGQARPAIEDELKQLSLQPKQLKPFFGGMVEASVWM